MNNSVDHINTAYLTYTEMTYDDLMKNMFKIEYTEKLGFLSDTHFGHKGFIEKEFLHLMSAFKKEGVGYVIHAGDVFQGTKYQDKLHPDYLTIEEQINYFNRLFPPQDELILMVIEGNHDLYKQDHNPVKKICEERNDVYYIGKYFGQIEIENLDGLVVEVAHTCDKNPIAKSPKTSGDYFRSRQRYLPDVLLPDVLIGGHTHTKEDQMYQKTRVIRPPAFIKKGHNSNNNTFGGFLEFQREDDNVIKIVSNWISSES